MTIISRPIRAFLMSGILIFCAFYTSVQAEDSQTFNKTWQHVAVKQIFNEPLENEEAIIWHLDTNGFAVRLPDCVMIFDYDKVKPAYQLHHDPDTGPVESLLTGVINPQELENERVIFFFSHDHPPLNLA